MHDVLDLLIFGFFCVLVMLDVYKRQVVASLSAIALATARVPAARVGFSNTPMGPFLSLIHI